MKKLNNYNKLNILGQGSIGKVYKVKSRKNNQEYALKVEYIEPGSNKNIGSSVWNEIEFSKTVAKKFPEQFIQLLSFDIIENCNENIHIPNFLTPNMKLHLKEKKEKKICIRKLYDIIDTSLSKLDESKMSLQQIYSIIIQLLYICYILEQSGWVHGDLHPGNIGIKYTDQEFIDILGNHRIPTFGIIVKAIDLGDIMHFSHVSDEKPFQGQKNTTELQHYTQHRIIDKMIVYEVMQDTTKYWDFIQSKNIKLDYIQDREKITEGNKSILEKISPHKDIQFRIYELLFPISFQKIILGHNFERLIENTYFVPKEDCLYFFYNFDNTELLINYFIQKMKQYII
jgi:serine/threonine protein kinase